MWLRVVELHYGHRVMSPIGELSPSTRYNSFGAVGGSRTHKRLALDQTGIPIPFTPASILMVLPESIDLSFSG